MITNSICYKIKQILKIDILYCWYSRKKTRRRRSRQYSSLFQRHCWTNDVYFQNCFILYLPWFESVIIDDRCTMARYVRLVEYRLFFAQMQSFSLKMWYFPVELKSFMLVYSVCHGFSMKIWYFFLEKSVSFCFITSLWKKKLLSVEAYNWSVRMLPSPGLLIWHIIFNQLFSVYYNGVHYMQNHASTEALRQCQVCHNLGLCSWLLKPGMYSIIDM